MALPHCWFWAKTSGSLPIKTSAPMSLEAKPSLFTSSTFVIEPFGARLGYIPFVLVQDGKEHVLDEESQIIPVVDVQTESPQIQDAELTSLPKIFSHRAQMPTECTNLEILPLKCPMPPLCP